MAKINLNKAQQAIDFMVEARILVSELVDEETVIDEAMTARDSMLTAYEDLERLKTACVD